MIIRGAKKLLQLYSQLNPGDVFIGRIPTGHLRHTLLIDLLERGVHCLPAPLAQTLNGSKAAQSTLLAQWMLPQTRVIRRRADFFEAMGAYQRKGIGSVITKEDRMHCGHGIRRWESIETLYNTVAFNKSSFPFVLQPYQQGFSDLRFVVVGDYVEAYVRHNNVNFRMNLAVGGSSRPHQPDSEQLKLCGDIMRRARFPYAHLDLLAFEDGSFYLSEIALDGGIKGALVGRQELEKRKKELLEQIAQSIVACD